jgi:hypothetical protein
VLPLVPEVPPPVPPAVPLVPELLGALGVTVPPLLAELGAELELLVLVPEEVMGVPHSLKP